MNVFDENITARCVAQFGIDPNRSYDKLQEGIRNGDIPIEWLLTNRRAAGRTGLLSPRETQVLRLVAGGHSLREICKQLWISHETGKSHMKSVRVKLGAVNTPHAVALALVFGLLNKEEEQNA